MKVALIDDRLLGRVVRGSTPPGLSRRRLATTGYWYVRLCQAVLRADDRSGQLSGPFAALPAGVRHRAIAATLDLSENVELVSLRELGPTIGRLRRDHPLNILGMEVLAAAEYLDADVFLSAASPQVQSALAHEGRAVRVVDWW